jgi:hypothetical protein
MCAAINAKYLIKFFLHIRANIASLILIVITVELGHSAHFIIILIIDNKDIHYYNIVPLYLLLQAYTISTVK